MLFSAYNGREGVGGYALKVLWTRQVKNRGLTQAVLIAEPDFRQVQVDFITSAIQVITPPGMSQSLVWKVGALQ